MNFNTKSAACSLLAGAFCLLAAPVVPAAGFYIPEVGTPSSLGTGGVANPTNTYGADASWTNPAGMTGLQHDEIMAGLQLILPKTEFDSSIATAGGSDGGNAGVVAPIPSFFYVNKVSDRLRLGFSVAGVLGGGLDYGDNFVGRYSTISAELAGVGLSPSLAWQVNDRLSLGAGVSFMYTLFNEEIAINPDLVPTGNGRDGKLKIEDATDWGYQPFFGLTYAFSDRALLGVVYRA
jgi:long-chain fatty acid transport protein